MKDMLIDLINMEEIIIFSFIKSDSILSVVSILPQSNRHDLTMGKINVMLLFRVLS